jgi:malonyl-CoA O-methyltransferase
VSGIAAESVWPDKQLARRRFDAAARSFDDAAFIHEEARARLIERLGFMHLNPAVAVDLGSARAHGARLLRRRYPAALLVAIDSSRAMLTRAEAPVSERITRLCADAEQLPLASRSIDLLFANLVLPWCRPERLFAEVGRVLSRDGLFVFSTLGPDTLAELRRAWARIDSDIHVHGFIDRHDLGDMLVRAGFAEPVMDVDRITVTYPDLGALAADLRAVGARNAAPGRRRSLTGRGRWRRVEALLGSRAAAGRLSVTVELIFGQAWGLDAIARRIDAGGEVAIPVDRIDRRQRRSR